MFLWNENRMNSSIGQHEEDYSSTIKKVGTMMSYSHPSSDGYFNESNTTSSTILSLFVGQSFESHDEAKDYYFKYATQWVFS